MVSSSAFGNYPKWDKNSQKLSKIAPNIGNLLITLNSSRYDRCAKLRQAVYEVDNWYREVEEVHVACEVAEGAPSRQTRRAYPHSAYDGL